MGNPTLSSRHPGSNVLAQLAYFLEWRPRLWAPAVAWLLGDTARFRDRQVLDFGCRSGRMSCLFGLLGATVLGVDLAETSLEPARDEAARWGVSERVRFLNYGGDPGTLVDGEFDFVFTKSVLVVIPELGRCLAALAHKMRPGGEFLAAENLAGGAWLNLVRRRVIHSRGFLHRFHGVDDAFLMTFQEQFEIIGQRRYFGIIAAIRGRRR